MGRQLMKQTDCMLVNWVFVLISPNPHTCFSLMWMAQNYISQTPLYTPSSVPHALSLLAGFMQRKALAGAGRKEGGKSTLYLRYSLSMTPDPVGQLLRPWSHFPVNIPWNGCLSMGALTFWLWSLTSCLITTTAGLVSTSCCC